MILLSVFKEKSIRIFGVLFLCMALAFGAKAQSMNGYGADDSSFVTQWTVTAATTVTIPITGSGFNISWWQGTGAAPAVGVNTVVASGAATSITFPAAGTYTVAIPPGTGAATRFSAISMSSSNSSAQYLTQVTQWGTTVWSSFSNAFSACSKLTITATDIPNLSNVTNMSGMFRICTSLAAVPNINSWNVSHVTNMSLMFQGNTVGAHPVTNIFNQDISNWDVSNVTNMSGMFYNDAAFNQNIGNWNVSSVTNMSNMFWGASAFNQPLNSWNVSNVTNMSNMFYQALAFNQDIGNWQTGKVTTMAYMFSNASSFNQNIDAWDVSNVTNMSYMFYQALAFNKDISNWNVSSVTDMSWMFSYTRAFNQPLEKWDVSNVTDMDNMFGGAAAFNQPLNNWDVSSVTNMSWMFGGTEVFNQPLDKWNTSNVTEMEHMFTDALAFNQNINDWDVSNVTQMYAMFNYQGWYNDGPVVFNQPLNKWNTSKVTNMYAMFQNTPSFNQNLGSWNLSSITTFQSLGYMFYQSGISCANYDSTLRGWAANPATPNGLDLGADFVTYDKAVAQAAHDSLTNLKGWTIEGDIAGSCVLPITLSSFSAVKQNNTALLQWTTATEINNKGFSIQRSTDAQTWADIGFVNSEAVNGNSSSSLDYSFTDNNPLNGINYYRLKQTDLNGAAVYSQVKSIDFGVNAAVYPNPASSQFKVSIAASSSYQLIDILGRTVLSGNLQAGNNVINVSGIANGTYLLRITSGGSSATYKVIVRK